MKVTGNLTITAKNAYEYSEIESVSGSLYIHAYFDALALTNVDGWLDVHALFIAPALTNVGRWLDVNTPFDAPVLTNVSGRLTVNAPFTAPVLTNVDGEETTKFSYMLGLMYPVLLTDNYVRIGCQRHTRDEWTAFTDSEIKTMDIFALSFWRKHKDDILNKNT